MPLAGWQKFIRDRRHDLEDCKRKFGWLGLHHLLQTALLKVNELSAWPDTEPPTTLDEARSFFRGIVESLVRSSI